MIETNLDGVFSAYTRSHQVSSFYYSTANKKCLGGGGGGGGTVELNRRIPIKMMFKLRSNQCL